MWCCLCLGCLAAGGARGPLWDHPVLTVWGGLMAAAFPRQPEMDQLEKGFPDPTQNNSVDTVCGAVAICWLFSLGAWFLSGLGVSVKASVMP